MPSFARIFQNEIVIKTLYCNKFAIHNTIDIVEVIGSSPTNPTKTKILETKAFQGFFFFREIYFPAYFYQLNANPVHEVKTLY